MAYVDPMAQRKRAVQAGTFVAPPGQARPLPQPAAVRPRPTGTPGAAPAPAPATPGMKPLGPTGFVPQIKPAGGGGLAPPPAVRPKPSGFPVKPPTGIAPPGQPRPMAPMAPPRSPVGPMDAITDFGPGNDLRFSQINPQSSGRLGSTQGYVNQAARSLGEGPNLTDAAKEKLRLFEEESEPGFQRALRAVGQKHAALGTMGSGMVGQDLGFETGVLGERERELGRHRRGLAADLAFSEGGERRANLGALAGLEGQQFGQEGEQRRELRGEREYQYGVGRDALDDRIRQRMLEESITGDQARRDLYGAGIYENQAAQGSGTAADLLSEMAYMDYLRKQQKAGAGAGPGSPARRAE